MLKTMLIFSPHERNPNFGIREIFCLWNPKSGKILIVDFGITLAIRIQNPSSTDKGWYPVTQWNLESRIQYCL